MSYHQPGDQVMTPKGPAQFVGYWPDQTLVTVRMRFELRTRTFFKSEIRRLDEACMDAVTDAFDKFFAEARQ